MNVTLRKLLESGHKRVSPLSHKVIFRLVLGSLFFLVGAVGPCSVALAQQTTRLSISPVTFELTANPGDTITNQLKVTNVSNTSLQLETRVENIASTGERGQVELTEDETKFSLSKWVSATPNQFELGPNETTTVTFSIKVPAFAEPGGHYGSLLVGTIASDTPNSTGAAVAQRVGSLLLVRVSGQTQEQAAITNFRARLFDGKWDEIIGSDGKTKILTAKDEQISEDSYKRYFQRGPIAFDLVVQNSGNVHVKPAGKVIIYNLFNQKVAELVLDSRNVFPGGTRHTTIIWPHKSPLYGIYYRAQLAAVYGSPQQALVADTTFWAFPLPLAIGIGVVALLLLILRKRLGRAVRILIKGA